MFTDLKFYIFLSELVSLFLLWKLWMSQEYLFLKILISFIVVVPFIGPFFYAFITDTTKPQDVSLMNENKGTYGSYTQEWITMRPFLKSLIKAKKRKMSQEPKSKN